MGSNVPSTTAPAASTGTPAQVPYAVRQINLTFQLGTGNFGGTGSNTVTISGLRVICRVDGVVSPQMGSTLIMKVYGMTLSQMNQISVAGLLFGGRQNTVLVQAGDSVLGLSTVFKGLIVEAYPMLSDAHDAHFYVYANVWPLANLKPVAPTSFPGSVSAATAIQGMATTAGFSFQNSGVTALLSAPYFGGTAGQQIQAAVKMANCFAYLDGPSNTLTIYPKIPSTTQASTITISPQTGMIGYPRFQARTIIVTTLFNPQIALRPSLTVLIRSQLAAADGAKLQLSKVTYDLSCQLPGGPWEVTVEGVPTQSQ